MCGVNENYNVNFAFRKILSWKSLFKLADNLLHNVII